jgi:hypothetical protein
MTAPHKTRWFLPLFALALGAAMLAVFWIGGNPDDGIRALVVLAAFSLVFLLGGRSDLIRGLRGDGRDEYWERLDIHATALAGLVAITAIVAMCMWEWSHGRDGSPYAQLGAITGVAYVLAIAFLRWRS